MDILIVDMSNSNAYIKGFVENVKSFGDFLGRPNHRYLSWEHCYKEFHSFKDKNKNNVGDEDIDRLSLSLGFYLASWGMMRGSSFLLWCDYKVHKEAVREILKIDYNDLWDMDCREISKYESQLNKIKDSIIKIYEDVRLKAEDEGKISDVLVTKILMGTIGCVPAYDRFFKSGLKDYSKKCSIEFCQTFNYKSICQLAKFMLIIIQNLNA